MSEPIEVLKNFDAYRELAAWIYRVEECDVTESQVSFAKKLYWFRMYGMGREKTLLYIEEARISSGVV